MGAYINWTEAQVTVMFTQANKINICGCVISRKKSRRESISNERGYLFQFY